METIRFIETLYDSGQSRTVDFKQFIKYGVFAVHEIDIARGLVNKESDTRAYLTQHVLITSISNELDMSFSMMKQCNCRATVLVCEESPTEEKDKVSKVQICTVGVKNRHGADYVTYTPVLV